MWGHMARHHNPLVGYSAINRSKYHVCMNCQSVVAIRPDHWSVCTEDEARESGMQPCGNCRAAIANERPCKPIQKQKN